MSDIKRYCHNLEMFLTSCDQTDLDAIQLEFELKNLSYILPENYVAKKTLEFIFENKLENLYPNTFIALRIFLTAPVTVATAERSFSKLKLIKNYLRSTMSQERLAGLAILSIEKSTAGSISYDSVVKNMVIRSL